jgi:hypothetical protein
LSILTEVADFAVALPAHGGSMGDSMIIIFGLRVLYSVLATGVFVCPHCATQRGYRLLRPRSWFHVFWIPLIPGSTKPEQVQCDACKSRWSGRVLLADTTISFQHRMGQRLPDYLEHWSDPRIREAIPLPEAKPMAPVASRPAAAPVPSPAAPPVQSGVTDTASTTQRQAVDSRQAFQLTVGEQDTELTELGKSKLATTWPPQADQGWYADPIQPGRQRFWEGYNWTTRIREVPE